MEEDWIRRSATLSCVVMNVHPNSSKKKGQRALNQVWRQRRFPSLSWVGTRKVSLQKPGMVNRRASSSYSSDDSLRTFPTAPELEASTRPTSTEIFVSIPIFRSVLVCRVRVGGGGEDDIHEIKGKKRFPSFLSPSQPSDHRTEAFIKVITIICLWIHIPAVDLVSNREAVG